MTATREPAERRVVPNITDAGGLDAGERAVAVLVATESHKDSTSRRIASTASS